MLTTETKTYSFKELIEAENDPDSEVTSRAVEAARHWLQEGQTDHEWWEYTYELWEKALDQIGFTDAKISFSGFYCQGCYASFTSGIDIERLIDFMTKEIRPKDCIKSCKRKVFGHDKDFRAWIVHKIGGKVSNPLWRFLTWDLDIYAAFKGHKAYLDAELMIPQEGHRIYGWMTQQELDDLFVNWQDNVVSLHNDLCSAIYKSLEEEYEYLTSDEALIETAEANNYLFDVEGEFCS